MNEASRWRLDLATHIAQAYMVEPHTAAVLLGGSAARGHADRYSDVEIGVFWHEPPGDATRQRILARVEADQKRRFPLDPVEHVWVGDYLAGRSAPDAANSGQFITVLSVTVDHVQRTLSDVLDRADPDEVKQSLIAALGHGVRLKGQPLLAESRDRAAHYPDSLAAAVVQRHGRIDHFWRHHMWVARDNRFMLARQLGDVPRRLLHLLLAVNRVYYSRFKWLDQIAAQCPRAPRDFLARFRALTGRAGPAAAERLGALVEETYDLVEATVPGVDVARLRSIFRWQRPLWGDTGPPIRPV